MGWEKRSTKIGRIWVGFPETDSVLSPPMYGRKGENERRILPAGHVIDLFKADSGPGPFLQSKWVHDEGCDVDIPLQL